MYMKKYRKKYKKSMKQNRGYHPYLRATAPAVGYVAAKVAEKVVKKYVNVEYKNYDVADIGFQNITDDPTVTTNTRLLNLVPTTGMEGPGQDREGAQIKMKSIQLKATILGNASDTTPTRVRVVLGLRLIGNAATLLYNSVYDMTESDATALATTNRVNAMRDRDGANNNIVLKEWNFCLDPASSMIKKIDYHRQFPKGIISKWTETDTTGSLSNMTKGVLFLMWLSDKNTDNYPTIIWNSRLIYLDN